ncbi:MAG TPA: trypsin-like serine protease [Streptosporangiaceae bacterium]|nr:trypsin-like serine protease [Streptosporangiaceae bacterium]
MARTTAAAVALAAGFALVAGCSSRPAVHRLPGPRSVPAAAAYWNRIRLLGALPLMDDGGRIPLPGESADSRPAATGESLRVGALFVHSASGNHFCTASVVSSPGKDLLITAAHCIDGGKDGGYRTDIVFIPGYRGGQEPFGVWTVARLLVAPQWAASSDPDYDVGFVVLQPHDGRSIEDVLGADRLGTDQQADYLVHVTGYPDSDDAPITCVNWTSQHSSTQLRFECGGFTGGTSGSPWVTRFSTRSRTGTIVGVIGGYQQGGDTSSVSYSVKFGAAVRALYDQAAGLTGP